MQLLRATVSLLAWFSIILLAILNFGVLPKTESKIFQSLEEPKLSAQVGSMAAESNPTTKRITIPVREIAEGVAGAMDVLANLRSKDTEVRRDRLKANVVYDKPQKPLLP